MIEILTNFDDTPLEKIETLEFDIKNYNQYINMWNEYKNKGLIYHKSNFDDDTWHFVLGKINEFNLKFLFDEIKFNRYKNLGILKNINYKEFIISIKSYILYSLNSTTGGNLVKFINHLNLLFNYLDEFELPNKLKSNKNFISSYIMISKFFLYIENYFFNQSILDDYEDLSITQSREEYHKESIYGKSQRTLPNFESMFKFNDIIEDFIKTSKDDEREQFFPIILWWKISTIIPLRSHEIVLIPLECIRKEKNKFFIKFYRNNLKGNLQKQTFIHSFNDYYKEEEFPISKEIVDLIEEYRSIVDKYDQIDEFYIDKQGKAKKRQFLFSYRSFKMFRDYINTPRKENEFFSENLLNTLRKLFFVKIVNQKYKISIVPKSKDKSTSINSEELEYIQLMDTRHFSIMNMIYMGYEPSTIQRIVGHRNIRTSYDYVNHTELFINCYTLSVAKQKALDKNSESKNSILDMDFVDIIGTSFANGNKRYNLVRKSKYSKKVVDGGFCIYDKSDMNPCKLLRGNHKRCPFFISNQNEIDIRNELNNMDSEISSEIKVLRYLIENKKNLIGYRDAYRTTINKIHSKVNNKAEILSNYIGEMVR